VVTYQDLPPADRAILALASHEVTSALIDGDKARAASCEDFFRWACGTYGIDPDETLTHL